MTRTLIAAAAALTPLAAQAHEMHATAGHIHPHGIEAWLIAAIVGGVTFVALAWRR